MFDRGVSRRRQPGVIERCTCNTVYVGRGKEGAIFRCGATH